MIKLSLSIILIKFMMKGVKSYYEVERAEGIQKQNPPL
jgi:hypothetical protein